jgi:hypothetical protein
MLFNQVRNHGGAEGKDGRLLVWVGLLLGAWLVLCVWSVHILSGLPSALAAQGLVGQRVGAMATAAQQKVERAASKLAAE